MKITRTSILTGKTVTRDVPVTQEQLDAWMSGVLIQDAMPDVSADEREFLISGITPEEWAEEFKNDQEEEEARDFLSDLDTSGRGLDSYGSLD